MVVPGTPPGRIGYTRWHYFLKSSLLNSGTCYAGTCNAGACNDGTCNDGICNANADAAVFVFVSAGDKSSLMISCNLNMFCIAGGQRRSEAKRYSAGGSDRPEVRSKSQAKI